MYTFLCEGVCVNKHVYLLTGTPIKKKILKTERPFRPSIVPNRFTQTKGTCVEEERTLRLRK